MLVPLVVIGAVTVQATTARLSGGAEPAWVAVRDASETTTTPVEIALRWHSGATLRAPNWSGLVQSVSLSVGDAVESGTAIAKVDGIVRLAVQTEEPFYRPLRFDDTGDDVAMLNEALDDLGYSHRADDYFGYDTRAGVKALAADIGADTSGVFDPAWFVFLPRAMTAVTVDLTVNTAAPSAGTEFITAATSIQRATVIERGGLRQLLATVESPVELALTDDDIEPVEHAVPGDSALTFGAETLSVGDDAMTLTDEAVTVLEDTVSAATPVGQAVEQRHPQPGDFVVPAVALQSGRDGAVCVVTRSAEAQPHAVPVTVVADVGARAIVSGSDLGDEVRVGEADGSQPCS